MTFPISRQGLEQIAIALAVGAAVFGLFALVRWRRGGEWQRFAQSAGFLGALIVVSLGIAYTIAPNIPTPPVPLTARFAQNPTPDNPATVAAGRGPPSTKRAGGYRAKGDRGGPAGPKHHPPPRQPP